MVILGSATPSVESRFNAEKGKYIRLSMPERIGGRPMPTSKSLTCEWSFSKRSSKRFFPESFASNWREAATERAGNAALK